MTVRRMDNVLIVVDDLEAAKAFFIELGLKLEGEQTVEGPLVGKLIGLKDVRATLAMMRTPDGQGIELDKFHTPDAVQFADCFTMNCCRSTSTEAGNRAGVTRTRTSTSPFVMAPGSAVAPM